MKAYLFVPCGERTIKKGEYYRQACTGKRYEFFRAEEDMNERLNGFEVVEPHEIEIPDYAISVSVESHVLGPFNDVCIGNFRHIPIPRPKKKVKKAQYITIHRDHCGRKRAEVTGWLTAAEAFSIGLSGKDKVEATEIEVEDE